MEQIFVGNAIWDRNKGPCIVKNINGGTGFQQDLRDDFNQVQHAVGGILIGYNFGVFGCFVAMINEPSEQDDELYRRTCLLGAYLNNENLSQLSGKLRRSIGDKTCQAIK